MDHFSYKKGILHAEDVAIPTIAAKVGTPFYCYSTATLTRHYNVFAEAFAAIPTTICFALKSNHNLAVIRTLAKQGAGADTVSEGEIRRAITAGVAPHKIVFSGVGKSRAELHYALSAGIGQFNVESREELTMLSEVAVSLGKTAPVAIRVNPNVDAITHDKITTGRKHDKFGVAWDQVMSAYALAASLPKLEIVGVTTHIGSQLTQLNPFQQAFKKITSLVEDLRAHGYAICRVDLGGGLGIPYNTETPPHPAEYAAMIMDTVRHLECELVMEPGRLIVGNAGILVSKVILVKDTGERVFVVLDAGMNDLMRPALYGSYHEIIPVIEQPKAALKAVDIVGPVCESSDVFARDRELPPLKENDVVAFRSAGAYGAVMSNSYNTRLPVPEVLVNGSDYAIIRPRLSYEDLFAQESMPQWL